MTNLGMANKTRVTNKMALRSRRRSTMVVIGDQHSHVVSDIVGTDAVRADAERRDQSNRNTRKPWVTPAWQRRDTPMEVTMYAGQR